MGKRRYHHYETAFSPESGEDGPLVTENYRKAFAAYQRTPFSATLWGVDELGEYTCILSK